MLLYVFLCCLFLSEFSFQLGLCDTCLELESGDLSNYSIEKIVGEYEVVMGVLGDSPLNKIGMNCNRVTYRQHAHPNGGVNLALEFFDNDRRSVLDTFLLHFNSSTDIYGTELGQFQRILQKRNDLYVKVLLATDNLFGYSVCIKNENGPDENMFLVGVLRRDGSTLTLSEVMDQLPESIKNHPGFKDLCDH